MCSDGAAERSRSRHSTGSRRERPENVGRSRDGRRWPHKRSVDLVMILMSDLGNRAPRAPARQFPRRPRARSAFIGCNSDAYSSPIMNHKPTLLLITASSPAIRAVRRSRVLNFQQITMPYLAALTPPEWTVAHIDEDVSPVDPTIAADLVGITFHTPSARHAYDLAAQFRGRGVPVVLGGPHVTLMPDEAQDHADVIFVGEAENLWEQFLEDFKFGRHARRYCYRAARAGRRADGA